MRLVRRCWINRDSHAPGLSMPAAAPKAAPTTPMMTNRVFNWLFHHATPSAPSGTAATRTLAIRMAVRIFAKDVVARPASASIVAASAVVFASSACSALRAFSAACRECSSVRAFSSSILESASASSRLNRAWSRCRSALAFAPTSSPAAWMAASTSCSMDPPETYFSLLGSNPSRLSPNAEPQEAVQTVEAVRVSLWLALAALSPQHGD